MRTLLAVILLLAAGTGIGVVAGSHLTGLGVDQAEAQSDKKNPYQEAHIGTIPTEFGTLKAAVGSAANNLALIFETDKGDLRILEFRGGKLNPRAYKADRQY